MSAVSSASPSRRRTAAVRTATLPLALVGTSALLAFVAAALGLLLPEAYAGARSTAPMLRGYDLVTAVVVAPALAIATVRARRGSRLAHLVVAASLAALVYTYAFFVLGTGFTALFLLHLAVFTTALGALVLVLVRVDVGAAAERAAHVPVWPAAAALGLLAVALGGMWTAAVIATAINGAVPVGSALVETAEIVHLSVVLDLGVQVPLYATAAALVLRRTGWGYVLAFVALAAGIPVQIAYLAAMPLQVAAGVPEAVPFDPLEPVIVAVYVAGLVPLLRRVPTSGRRPPHEA